MLPIDRVAAAFSRQPSDRVPIYQAGFSSRAASFVLHREAYVGGGIQQYREAAALWQGPAAHAEYLERSFAEACDLCEALDLDLVRTLSWRAARRPPRYRPFFISWNARFSASIIAWQWSSSMSGAMPNPTLRASSASVAGHVPFS